MNRLSPLLVVALLGCGRPPAPREAPSPPPPRAEVHPVAPAPPEPAQEPEPFEGRKEVTVDELVAWMTAFVPVAAQSEAMRRDYQGLLAKHELPDSDALFQDYVKVSMVFEATRDGGLWGLSWRITDRDATSDRIWEQWSKLSTAPVDWGVTATAECDELSALFAFLVRRMGVKRVGLFWPVWNHTVAVWTIPRGKDKRAVRVVIPTSQIFLSRQATLGTTEFNAWTQKTIYDYWRRDAPGTLSIPAPLARYFVRQLQAHASRSHEELQVMRNQRGGS